MTHMCLYSLSLYTYTRKQGLEKRLSGTAFLSKAPPELVQSTQQTCNEKKEQLATIQKSITEL